MFDEEKENFLYWLSTKLEQNYERKTIAKLFAIGLVGNILSWLIAFSVPIFISELISTLVNIVGKIGYYLLIVPFSFAFLIAFSILKLKVNKVERVLDEEKEFLDGYFENLWANDYRIIFLLSAAFGGLNCILLVFALVTFSTER